MFSIAGRIEGVERKVIFRWIIGVWRVFGVDRMNKGLFRGSSTEILCSMVA